MRAYIGVDCTVPELLAYQREQFSGLKLCAPLHVTLKFLGEIPEHDLASVHALLEKVHAPAFSMKTGTLTSFHNPARTKLLMLAIQHNKSLLVLQQKITKVLSSLYTPEKNFVPHLSVARSNKPVSVFDFASPVPVRIVCTAFYLYVKKDGGYKKLRRYGLT